MFQAKQFKSRSMKSGGGGKGGAGGGGGGGLASAMSSPFGFDPTFVMGRHDRGGAPSNNDAEQPSLWELTKDNVRRQLWSYVGLVGVFCMYFGVLVCVYALKGLFAQRLVMIIFGALLAALGAVNLFVSWIVYLYQRKKRRFAGACCCFGGDPDDDGETPVTKAEEVRPPSREKTRPRGHSLAGFLTPEFAKYAEFSARDRRYDSKRYRVFRAYDPTQISISFAHKYWLEQQKKPLLQSGNPSSPFPSSVPTSPIKIRTPQSSETKRKGVPRANTVGARRQLST